MINFFMTISLAIALFISLYYITPANYEVVPNQKYSEKKYDKYIKIKSGSIYKLDHTSIQNLNIVFDKNIELIFSNILKSQNIIYKKNTIIKSINSDITIVNSCNKDIKVGIKFIQ